MEELRISLTLSGEYAERFRALQRRLGVSQNATAARMFVVRGMASHEAGTLGGQTLSIQEQAEEAARRC